MARRKPYSKVKKSNRIRTDRAKGKGDVLYRGFECLNPPCDCFIEVLDSECGPDFEIECPKCSYVHSPQGKVKLYDYEVLVTEKNIEMTMESGFFSISHRDYIDEAQRLKFCIVCNKLKPVEDFDRHTSRRSGRQGECRLCKKVYNSIKNATRLQDQHREAANRRRMMLDIAHGGKIDVEKINERFGKRCFNCGLDLSADSGNKSHLDHTLPIYYLWPLTTDNATLLCSECNGAKTNRWPSDFYSVPQLQRLSVLTGIEFKVLSGPPQFNPESIDELRKSEVVRELLEKYAKYENEVFRLRNRIELDLNIDIFTDTGLNPLTIQRADALKI